MSWSFNSSNEIIYSSGLNYSLDNNNNDNRINLDDPYGIYNSLNNSNNKYNILNNNNNNNNSLDSETIKPTLNSSINNITTTLKYDNKDNSNNIIESNLHNNYQHHDSNNNSNNRILNNDIIDTASPPHNDNSILNENINNNTPPLSVTCNNNSINSHNNNNISSSSRDNNNNNCIDNNCGGNNNSSSSSNHSLISTNMLESILKDIPDDQLTEEQILKIKMIKNEILSLTKSIKYNNNNFNNIATTSTNNNSESQQPIVDEYIDEDYEEDYEEEILEDYDDGDDKQEEDEDEEEYIIPFIYTNNELTFNQIKELISIIESTPKLYGKEWALVNQSWYSQWERGIFSKDYLGPIDNYPLLDITDDSNQLLRCDIKEYQDFIAVPVEVWDILKDVYGGSPDIIRKVTDKGQIDFRIPTIVYLIKSSDINECSQITKSYVFQYENFFTLKKRACQIFNLSFSEFDLYNFDGGSTSQELYLFLTLRDIKLYNNQMILVKEKKHPIFSQDSTTSSSSSSLNIPVFDFKNDPKFLELIQNRNIGYSTSALNNNHQNESNITMTKRNNVDRSCLYTPFYTDPFCLSFISYSFIKSSYRTLDPDEILTSDQYIQFERIQNNHNSNIDQIQSFSFDSKENNNNINSNHSTNNNNSNNNNDNNNINISNNNSNNNNNNNNNNHSSNNDNLYFHGLDIEDNGPKKSHRPPKCKVN